MENTIRLAQANRALNQSAICNFTSPPKFVLRFPGKTKYVIAAFTESASKPRADKPINSSDEKPFRHGSS
jgi:hypothetical protein